MARTILGSAESWAVVEAGIRKIYGNKFDNQTIARYQGDYFQLEMTSTDHADGRSNSYKLEPPTLVEPVEDEGNGRKIKKDKK